MSPVKAEVTLMLDYPRRSRDRKGCHVAERSLVHRPPLRPITGRVADGPRDVLYSLRPDWGEHSQEPLRLFRARWHGVLEDHVRRARAAPPGAPEAPGTRPVGI